MSLTHAPLVLSAALHVQNSGVYHVQSLACFGHIDIKTPGQLSEPRSQILLPVKMIYFAWLKAASSYNKVTLSSAASAKEWADYCFETRGTSSRQTGGRSHQQCVTAHKQQGSIAKFLVRVKEHLPINTSLGPRLRGLLS